MCLGSGPGYKPRGARPRVQSESKVHLLWGGGRETFEFGGAAALSGALGSYGASTLRGCDQKTDRTV